MPSSPAPSQISMSLTRAVAVAKSPFSGSQQVAQYPYALWTATVQLPPMKRDKAADWQSFFLQLQGRAGTFLMGNPDAVTPRGSARSASVSGGASRGSTTASLSGSGTLLNGDFIQFGSGAASRLHMVVAGGNTLPGVVTFEPALKADYAPGTAVTLVNARGLWRLDVNDLAWDSDRASVFSFSFSATEAF